MRVKLSKQPPPAPTASAVGPCPTVFKIVGRPGTGSLPSTFAPPDHPPVTPGRWTGGNERLCAMEPSLQQETCPPPAGFEPRTARSAGQISCRNVFAFLEPQLSFQ